MIKGAVIFAAGVGFGLIAGIVSALAYGLAITQSNNRINAAGDVQPPLN